MTHPVVGKPAEDTVLNCEAKGPVCGRDDEHVADACGPPVTGVLPPVTLCDARAWWDFHVTQWMDFGVGNTSIHTASICG